MEYEIQQTETAYTAWARSIYLTADINGGQVEVSLTLTWDDCQGYSLDVHAVEGGNEDAVAKVHKYFDNLKQLDLYNFDEETA